MEYKYGIKNHSTVFVFDRTRSVKYSQISLYRINLKKKNSRFASRYFLNGAIRNLFKCNILKFIIVLNLTQIPSIFSLKNIHVKILILFERKCFCAILEFTISLKKPSQNKKWMSRVNFYFIYFNIIVWSF